ncbi:hypothetical protein MJA45_15565 [Paenibacillus aurantius]|uniref:Uncharacterized protein n=1 Tax=Paenibacillus aurantius TaxID=2918900 RepID=A0AA96LB16_9BACL|nr:hypothetical protein [Paenibacillus aurantius]WNQ09065.1 hypothetical protein MJA45_15565 [Paenibacillus aurantius]
MKELVGHCVLCGRPVYCDSGFLDGVVRDDGKVQCRSCPEEEEPPSKPDAPKAP